MKTIRTQLRMPEQLHQWLIQRARNNDRSMNAEINRIMKAEQQREEANKTEQAA